MELYQTIDSGSISELKSTKEVSKRIRWTKEEDNLLIKIVNNNPKRCWKTISSFFENKSKKQCFSRFKRLLPEPCRDIWTPEEDDKIVNLVAVYGKCWTEISKHFTLKSSRRIRSRYLNVLDRNLNRSKFSEEEDKLIASLYIKYGPRWAYICKFFTMRTPDMIKNRFYSHIKKHFDNMLNVNFFLFRIRI
jgi:myb proto-oncogene protein